MSQCGLLMPLPLLVSSTTTSPGLVEVRSQGVLSGCREVVDGTDGQGGCREMRKGSLGVALLKGGLRWQVLDRCGSGGSRLRNRLL